MNSGTDLAGTDGVHHHDEAASDDARDRRDVADEIEVEFVVERRVGRVGAPDHEQRVSVCGRAHDRLGTDVGTATGLLSITNCWPSRSDNHWPMTRAVMSVPPPAANGTIRRIGRDG